jgi:hypothetical protein
MDELGECGFSLEGRQGCSNPGMERVAACCAPFAIGGEHQAVGTTVISAHLTGPALLAPDAEHAFPSGGGQWLADFFREVSS